MFASCVKFLSVVCGFWLLLSIVTATAGPARLRFEAAKHVSQTGDSVCHSSRNFHRICPFANATCCPDTAHCCPQTFQCDVTRRMCSSPHIDFTWKAMDRIPHAKKRFKDIERRVLVKRHRRLNSGQIMCPGGTALCPDATTCCQMKVGGWGCCPVQNAVCCGDMVHCCPQNMKCDNTSQTCISLSADLDRTVKKKWLTKVRASPAVPAKQDAITCPDHVKQCADSNTCCLMSTGSWGCCPFQNATCCGDGIHCCPNGSTCDTSQNLCRKHAQLPVFPRGLVPSR